MISRRLLRIKVVKAMYAWLQVGDGDIKVARKRLRESVDAVYALYFQMLWLAVELRNYAAERIELGKTKHLPTPEERNPNMRFVENRVIEEIFSSEVVNEFLKKHKTLGWHAAPELIKELYNSLVASDFYARYMAGGSDDVQVLKDFYSAAFLEDSELLECVLEEQSTWWSDDDMGMAIIMVVKSLGKTLRVLPEFKDEEDSRFADKLFVQAVDEYDENLRLVEQFATNWDVERIALMDNLIAATAAAELRSFKDIPARVTLDEYIEIAKYYSTPGSNQFINGILDKIAEKLDRK